MATKRIQRRNGSLPQLGITLLEVCIVVAVIAIVAATAAPSFSALIEARRLEGAATRLAADVQFVRGEALARNQPLRLSVRSGADATCWIVHTGSVADCTCAGGGAVCGGSTVAIKSVALPGKENVAVTANVATIVFDPLHGTSSPTGTLRVSDGRGRSVHHIVNVVGRVRSCAPGGAFAAYPAC